MEKLLVIALLLSALAGCASGPRPTAGTQFSWMPETTYRHTSVNLHNSDTIYTVKEHNPDIVK